MVERVLLRIVVPLPVVIPVSLLVVIPALVHHCFL